MRTKLEWFRGREYEAGRWVWRWDWGHDGGSRCHHLGANEQVVRAELVEAADADAQFEGDGCGRDQAGPGLSEEMADEVGGGSLGELRLALGFFMARKVTGRRI